MSATHSDQVTSLLEAWGRGDGAALNQLIPLVYSELHRLAHHYMKGERPGHGLQTTALINEAYLRLSAGKQLELPDRTHFFASCARAMRQILVDWARTQHSLKRQADFRPLALEESLVADPSTNPDLVAVDDALNALAALDPRKAQIVEMRFFGGFTIEEISKAMSVSVGTVMRDWNMARLFLRRQMSDNPGDTE